MITEEVRSTINSSKTSIHQSQTLPIITLLFLAPTIAELLFGSTHITVLFAFIPEIGIYGSIAIIFRYLVRQQQRGWFAILLLGIAFAIAEECIIQQTSLAPLIGVDPQHIYGRVFDVNWVYFLWAIGYESIWGILLPIYLTELIFPNQRKYLWIGKRGVIIATFIFIITSVIVWYSWTQIAAPLYSHQPPYQTPIFIIIIAVFSIALLIIGALKTNLESFFYQKQIILRSAPKPYTVASITCLFGLSWFVLVLLAYGIDTSLPVIIPIILGICIAGIFIFLIRYWSNTSTWNDMHRLGLISGAIIANMLAGFVTSGISLPIDYIGKLIFNILTIFLLIYLAKKISINQKQSMPI